MTYSKICKERLEMKKICACVLILLMTCSKAFAAIPEYDTISPINLTIGTFNYIQGTENEASFVEAIRHFAVAVHEMTTL